jgi:hypothetical protein
MLLNFLTRAWGFLKTRAYLGWLIAAAITAILLKVIFSRRGSPDVSEIIRKKEEQYAQAIRDLESYRKSELERNPFRKE